MQFKQKKTQNLNEEEKSMAIDTANQSKRRKTRADERIQKDIY